MLADLPRGVERLLRDAGVPAAPLPRESTRASGAGRFVLFDSSRRGSVTQWNVARAQGLTGIDLRALCARCDELESVAPIPHGHGWTEAAGILLERLKGTLEQLGGIWARLADFPFPFQSALCLAVEYPRDAAQNLSDWSSLLPGETTHFVPSRYRPVANELSTAAGPPQIGWRIGPEDCLSSSRRTVSHWETRLSRFRDAELEPQGVMLADPRGRLPGTKALWDLGLRYLVQPHADSPRIGAAPYAEPTAHWVDAGLTLLPSRDRFLEWVADHYQSGRPLFVTASAERVEAVEELRAFQRDALRCSLLWQTSLANWARFWSARRKVRFEVIRGADGVLIQPLGDVPTFAWGVELWRGSHFATLPLRLSGLQVSDDGLPYLLASRRNPAGCAVPGGEISPFPTPRSQPESGSAVG